MPIDAELELMVPMDERIVIDDLILRGSSSLRPNGEFETERVKSAAGKIKFKGHQACGAREILGRKNRAVPGQCRCRQLDGFFHLYRLLSVCRFRYALR